MKGKWLLLALALPLYALPQSTFMQLYPNTNDFGAFKDMVQVSANEYAFITETIFYRVDGNGKVLLKKDLKEGQSTFLESAMVDNTGNFYIAAQVLATVSTPEMIIYKLNSSGQVLFRKLLAIGSPHKIRIIPALNNHFFVAYLTSGASQRLVIHLLDNQGIDQWRKELLRDITNSFAAHATSSGEAELVFITQGDGRTWMARADLAGDLTEKEIMLPQPANVKLVTSDFCRTPDGGIAFAGDVTLNSKPFNGLLYKTDKDGQLQWKQEIDVFRGDRFLSLAATADGLILLGTTGLEGSWGSTVAGDIILVKTDWQGHTQWKRALGTANTDYGMKLLVPDAHSLLIGGMASYPGYSSLNPMLCKADHEGNLRTSLPFQPTLPIVFKKIQVVHDGPVQKLVKAAAGPNGALILAGNFLHKADDQYYPYIIKSTPTGEAVWHKKITVIPGIIRALTPTIDGNYMGMVEQNGFIGKGYLLVKFTSDGDTLWTAKTGMTLLRDLIATADGGYLLGGSEDLSLSDLDAILIKTDANGKEIWRKKTGIRSQWETVRSIRETPENDLIIVGNSQLAFGGPSSAWAYKVNKNGDLLWSKVFDAGTGLNYLYDVVLTPNNEYLMAGTAGSGFGDSKDILLMRLNQKGDKVWEKTYDLHLQEEGYSVHVTAQDTILVAGTTGEPAMGKLEKYGFLLKLNKDGIKQSVQYLGKQGVQTNVEKILIAGGKVILAGNTQDEYGEGHMYFTTADAVAVAPPEEPEAGSLTLYPNPTRSKVFISMKSNYIGPVNIVLYNTTGQQVLVLQRTKTSFELKEEVPLTNLSSGMYYFFIQHGTDKSVKRLEIVNR